MSVRWGSRNRRRLAVRAGVSATANITTGIEISCRDPRIVRVLRVCLVDTDSWPVPPAVQVGDDVGTMAKGYLTIDYAKALLTTGQEGYLLFPDDVIPKWIPPRTYVQSKVGRAIPVDEVVVID